MPEYIDREDYCKNLCHCHNEYCDKESCPIWKAPAADVAPVVHGKPVTKMRTETLTGYHEEIGKFAEDGANLYRKKMIHADIPYYHCPVCSATLCSRWHNYCGKCGARMDGGN